MTFLFVCLFVVYLLFGGGDGGGGGGGRGKMMGNLTCAMTNMAVKNGPHMH